MSESIQDLVFSAKIISDDPNFRDRKFSIIFSMNNDSIKVWEKESDGFKGGFFFKTPRTNVTGKFNPNITFIGNIIEINHTSFLLTDAPESTLNYMESQPDLFSVTDLLCIVNKLHECTTKEELLNKFQQIDKNSVNQVNLDEAEKIFSQTNLNPHEIRTLIRRYRFYNTKWFLYSDFFAIL